eukprot:1571447-Rhodomonas_salina.1
MALPISLGTLAYGPSIMADVPAAVCADLNRSYARNTTVCLPKLRETLNRSYAHNTTECMQRL